jgi:hypothetical protein
VPRRQIDVVSLWHPLCVSSFASRPTPLACVCEANQITDGALAGSPKALEVEMTATMTILLSVSLFASVFYMSQSGAAEESDGTRRERPTGFENYV